MLDLVLFHRNDWSNIWHDDEAHTTPKVMVDGFITAKAAPKRVSSA
jgi:hypothetical protein